MHKTNIFFIFFSCLICGFENVYDIYVFFLIMLLVQLNRVKCGGEEWHDFCISVTTHLCCTH